MRAGVIKFSGNGKLIALSGTLERARSYDMCEYSMSMRGKE